MKTRIRDRQRLYGPLFGATLVSAIGVPNAGWSQTADATLRGKAAANAEVTAKNVATGATRRTKANADGRYTLIGMPPGTYRLDAGPGTEHTVTVSVASVATLDLTPGSEAAAPEEASLEQVIIRATRLVEVRTSEVGSTVSQQQIATVPQVTRNFLEFADTVPGMVFTIDSGGDTSLRGGAMSDSSVNVYIDGVGQKSYVKEGGVSGQFFSQGNPFPQLAIGEYKVITSNYKAEYDQISSAAVTAETKSGTNEFHGEIFGNYTNQNWRAETPSEAAAGMKTDSNDKEYGFSIGGPIIRNQMHFFFTYEGKKYNTPVAVTPGVAGVERLLPADVAAQFGPSGLPFTENLYFGKIDWAVTDRDRLELSSKVRNEDQIQNIGVGQPESASIDTKNNDTRVDLRWQHSADHWFNDLLVTYEDAFNAPSARGIGNGSVYTYGPNDNQTIVSVGPASAGATQNKGQKGTGIQEDLTLKDLRWLGIHTMKMGAKYKKVTLTAMDAADINPQFYYNVTEAGTDAIPYEASFTNPVPGLNPVAESKDEQFGVYFQDDWAATDRLIWNLGLRWDYEKNPSYLNYVTPANVVAALKGPNPDPAAPPGQTYAQALALGGVNVDDYISNGHNRSAYTGAWQPRLGFSFDLNGDQKHVIFGGVGRSYDRNLYDYLQVEQTKAALPQYTVYFDGQTPSGSPSFPWNPNFLKGLSNLQALFAATNAGFEVDAINNNLKAPYSDQFSIGIRNKIGDWNTSATIARLVSHDGFVFTLGSRDPTGAFWVNGGQPWGDPVPGFDALIIGSNGIETRNTELLISAEKPYTAESGWGATIAYTYTSADQNRDIGGSYSFDEATIQQYPFMISNAAAKHRLVATGSIRGPWNTMVAAKLTLATPTPVNDIACYGPGFPTGSPCTPIAGIPDSTLGYKDVDVQVTKNFDLVKDQTIYLRLDMLNIFDFANYSDTLNNWATNDVPNSNPVTYNRIGNITGVPREIKLTAGYKF